MIMDRSRVANVPGVVVAMAGSTAEGADGVSGSLRSRGEFETVAASYPAISNTDADQYATGDGSCVDASVMGWFRSRSLDKKSRGDEAYGMLCGHSRQVNMPVRDPMAGVTASTRRARPWMEQLTEEVHSG
jgi:hypothetical protein